MIEYYYGDCLEIMDKLIERDIKIDAIITDIPYGTTACKWDVVIPFDEMWKRLNKLIKHNGAIVLFGNEPFSSALRMSNIKDYKYDLIWNKNTSMPGLSKIRPMPSFENISIFGKERLVYNPQMEEGKPYIDNRNSKRNCSNDHKYGFNERRIKTVNTGTRYPKSIINITKYNKKDQHPTKKPLKLMEYLVKTYTNENDLVLDFTCGSGNTGVACRNLNRNCILVDNGVCDNKNSKYIGMRWIDVAKDRIENGKFA